MHKLFDCVLAHKNNKHYFFRDGYYARYTPGVGVDPGYPKRISSHWPTGNPAPGYKKLATVMEEEGWDYFDAVLPKSDYEAYYFFKGKRYVRYESGKGVPDSYPEKIDSSHWYDMWKTMPGPYDGAFFSRDKHKYYFFKGSKYLRITPNQGIDANYPRSVSVYWRGLGTYFPGAYTAVSPSQTNDRITYFFKGDEYVRYKHGHGIDNAIGDGEWAYPQSTVYRWPGVWSLRAVSALTLGAFKSYREGDVQKIGPTFSIRQLKDDPVSMEAVSGVTLDEIKKIENDNYKGVTKWFLLKGMSPGEERTITLKSNGNKVETFQVKNAPLPGTNSPFKFAVSSCLYDAMQIQSRLPTVDRMQSEAPDFMIWNGDTSYYVGPNGTNTSKANVLIADMKNQHRMFLRMYKTRHHPSIAAAMRTIPAVSTWDDHDFGFNNAHTGPGNGQMTAGQVNDAVEVFRTCWPNDYAVQNMTASIEHSFPYGNVAFFFPDGRSYRNPGAEVILGDTQRINLINEMSDGPLKDAALKVVVLGSQLISTRNKGEGFYHTAGGSQTSGERMRLLTAFTDGSISGRILVLSGDVHYGELSYFGGTANKPKLIEVTSSPLLLKKPAVQKFPDPDPNSFRVWSTRGNTYALINILYDDGLIVDIRLRDAAGVTTNIYRPGGGTGGNWSRAKARWDQEGNLNES